MAKKKEQEQAPQEHSPKFDTVKEYYNSGMWKKKAVRRLPAMFWIATALTCLGMAVVAVSLYIPGPKPRWLSLLVLLSCMLVLASPFYLYYLITNEGILIRMGVSDISIIGRNTSGVKLMSIDPDSDTKVATIAKVRESSNNQDEEVVDEPAAETEIEENGVQE